MISDVLRRKKDGLTSIIGRKDKGEYRDSLSPLLRSHHPTIRLCQWISILEHRKVCTEVWGREKRMYRLRLGDLLPGREVHSNMLYGRLRR